MPRSSFTSRVAPVSGALIVTLSPAPAAEPSPTRMVVDPPSPASVSASPATVQPVPMNCTPLADTAPWLLSIVTVPFAALRPPWNTAKLPSQRSERAPAALVQLVVGPALQIPDPPTIAPVGVVAAPFQNWIGPGPSATTTLTWLATEVCTVRSATLVPIGTLPIARPLSVSAPP